MNKTKKLTSNNILNDPLFSEVYSIFANAVSDSSNEILAYFQTEDLRIDMNDPNKNPEGITGIQVSIEYEDDEVIENTYYGIPCTQDGKQIKNIKDATSAYEMLHYIIWNQRFYEGTFEAHIELLKCNIDFYAYITIQKIFYDHEETSLQNVG